MSKIVCEVCGTAYQDTVPQCPICGNAKSDSAGTSGDSALQNSGYAYVKGGRFSPSNVRKRNNGKTELPRTVVPAKSVENTPISDSKEGAAQEEPQQTLVEEQKTSENETAAVMIPPPRRRKPRKQDNMSSNIGLLIIVIILILAIIAVSAYIVVRLIRLRNDSTLPSGSNSTSSSQIDPSGSSSNKIPSSSSTVGKPALIPCVGIRVSKPNHTFYAVGETLLLEATPQPADTTDPILFTSSDPYIASVDSRGKIVAVAKGTVTITVRCGDFTAICEITCMMDNEPAYPTEPPPTTTTRPVAPTTRPTEPFVKLELNRKDFTLKGYGDTHNLYSGQIDPSAITWTSTNENVATVENGIVTAVGNGTAEIIAEYRGQRVTCIVRCNNVVKPIFELASVDVTIKVGGKFTMVAYALNDDGTKTPIDPSELKFKASDYCKGSFTVDEKGVVTGVKNNSGLYDSQKLLYVAYKGQLLQCIVRVV